MVRVYFDDNLVDNPFEWEELGVSILFDHTNQITSIEYDTELTFSDSGFEYLYDRRATTCELVSVRVEMDCGDTTDTIIKGFIFITDCTFDELECSVRTVIQDDGFSSKIQNNKSTSVSLAATQTKNGEAITAAEERIVFLFRPSDGLYQTYARGYSVFETFKFMVSWMSDNSVGFESDYFETGDGKGDWLVSGVDLRNRESSISDVQRVNPVSTSFEDLFTLMRKLTNIAIGFQRNSDNEPVIRIEPLSFFRNSDVVLNLSNVNKTELSFVKEILFAKINIGSEITRPSDCDNGNTDCSAPNNISYYGFDIEEYSITGECNEDITLDLSVDSSFVIDTNTIEDVIMYDNESYDKETFLISTFENTPNSFLAEQNDVLDTGVYWYNEKFTNKEILLRYIDYLTGELVLYGLYDGLNLFTKLNNNFNTGVLSPNQTPSYQEVQLTFNGAETDPFDRYNNFGEFVPVDEGVYKFCLGVSVEEFGAPPNGITVLLQLNVETYTSGNVLIDRYSSDLRSYITGDPAQFETWESGYIPMDSGDYAIFTVSYAQATNPAAPPGQATIFLGNNIAGDDYFQCCQSRVVIQDIQSNTGEERRVSKTSLTYQIPWENFKQYLNDTTKLIGVSNQRINRVGWNNEIRHNFITGVTEMSILSNDV